MSRKEKKSYPELNRRIFVAMSGGVDSSVAAALLKGQGFKVTGVFFKPWQPENGIAFCNWQKDRQDAMKVAVKLGIPFLTWDFSKEYEKKVAKYIVSSYRNGYTPNPDVMCNKEIKFGLFLKKALEHGADYIATGHYARKREVKSKKSKIKNSEYELLKAKDENKDQTYFLWTLTQKKLKYCLFPIGDYTKPEVRQIAKKLSLLNWDKKDSQGVCFIGDLDMRGFLKEFIKPKGGIVKNLKGKIIGSHDGVAYYTIGQRHGFKINVSSDPYFVIKKDLKNNTLYVGKNKSKNSVIKLKNVSWISGKPEKSGLMIDVKIRYRNKSLPAIIKTGPKKLDLRFLKTPESATPGQSVVIYKGQKILGGGIII